MRRVWIAAVAIVLMAQAGCHDPRVSKPAFSAKLRPCLADRVGADPASPTAGMVLIRGGQFIQGAAGALPEEGPPRRIRVGSFWIDRTEVTNDDFARFVTATGYVTLTERPLDPATYPGLSGEQLKPSAIVFKGDDSPTSANPGQWWRVVQGADWRHPLGPGSDIVDKGALPVVQIGWEDALAYARWLGRDLPTEAEWEYAARGGLESARYAWGDQPLDPGKPQANVWQGVFPVADTGDDGYKAQVAPVGCFAANGYGLFDMTGNVWEWTRDWYAPGLDPSQVVDPIGPVERAAYDPADPVERKHVVKGGSFLCADNFCFRYRPPARQAGPADTGSSHVGFRTVLRVGAKPPSPPSGVRAAPA